MTDQPQETRSRKVQIWGVAIILLMIVLMLFPINLGGGQSDRRQHGVLIGTTASGMKVMSQDRMYAANLIETLETIQLSTPQAGQGPLLTLCWGEEVVREFKKNPEALYLLLDESRRYGPGANTQALGPLDAEQQSPDAMGVLNSGRLQVEDLHALPTSPLSRIDAQMPIPFVQIVVPRYDRRTADGHLPLNQPSALPPLEQERIYSAMRDFLTIQSAASLSNAAIKPTAPMVDRLIAQRAQAFSLQVAAFNATNWMEQVGEPTDAQLQAQLKAYADVAANLPTKENPFGFGYRVEDRVKLQIISFNRGDVRNVVQAEKSPYEWEVEARKLFRSKPEIFNTAATQPSPATRQASATQPAAAASTQPAPQSFDQVKSAAINRVIDLTVDARVSDIEKRIRSTMTNDYQAWNMANLAKTTTAPSSLNVPYDSGDYLDKLAADIQGKFKVLPTVERHGDRFRGTRDLVASLPGSSFARTTFVLTPTLARALNLQSPVIDGPTYAVRLAEAFLPPRAVPQAGDVALDLFEPSAKLADPFNELTLFFRLTATEANHPAQGLTAENRGQLATDWKRAAAQQKAVEAAQAAVAKVSSDGSFNIPGATSSSVEVGPFAFSKPAPPELDLAGPAYLQFLDEMTDKLMGAPEGQHVAVLNVPLGQKVYVARRTALRASWTSEQDLAMTRVQVRMYLASLMSQPRGTGESDAMSLTDRDIMGSWLNVAHVYERSGWKPAIDDSAK